MVDEDCEEETCIENYDDDSIANEINSVLDPKEEDEQKPFKNEPKMFNIHLCGDKNYCDCENSQENLFSDNSAIDWQSLNLSYNLKETPSFFIIADFEKKLLNRLYNKNTIDVKKYFFQLTRYIIH